MPAPVVGVPWSSSAVFVGLAALCVTQAGCWVDVERVTFEEVAFSNPFVKSPAGVVRTFELPLTCPDGEPARFYAVYDPAWEGPRAVAVVLHSSAFDYIVDALPGTPPVGPHFAPPLPSDPEITRLHQPWGVGKVWETLGMYVQVDPTEVHGGAVPATLLDNGVAALYPINCWGDLWHNEQGEQGNDEVGDLFARNGRTLAAWMGRLLVDEEFTLDNEITLPFTWNGTDFYLVGFGDGAHGVAAVLERSIALAALGRNTRFPEVTALVVDSPVDDYTDWATLADYADHQIGMERVFNYDAATQALPNFAQWSLERLVRDGELQGTRVGLLYSVTDTQVPRPGTHYDGLVDALAGLPTGQVWRIEAAGHVFSNNDEIVARQVVGFLQDAAQ